MSFMKVVYIYLVYKVSKQDIHFRQLIIINDMVNINRENGEMNC